MPIKFQEGTHYYTKQGEPRHEAGLREARKEFLYPSPTTIIKSEFTNPALDRYKTIQLLEAASSNYRQPHESIEQYEQRLYDLSLEHAKTAADFGKDIHDAIEHYPQLPLDPALHPWINKFGEWYQANGIATIATEKIVLDHDLGVAGRLDRVVTMGGRVIIPDIKTQGIKPPKAGKKKPAYYDSWPIQLSFYAVAYAKETQTFPSIPECMSVVMDSTEASEPYVKIWPKEEILYSYQRFVNACWGWFSSRGYWPVAEWGPPTYPQIPMPL